MNLTKNEIEVMDVFWGVGRPLSRAELLNLSVDKSWHAVEKRTDEPLKRH